MKPILSGKRQSANLVISKNTLTILKKLEPNQYRDFAFRYLGWFHHGVFNSAKIPEEDGGRVTMKIQKKSYYCISFRLSSPLAVGSGQNEETDKDLMRNGNNVPYLPASAIAV